MSRQLTQNSGGCSRSRPAVLFLSAACFPFGCPFLLHDRAGLDAPSAPGCASVRVPQDGQGDKEEKLPITPNRGDDR
jgi:hypothetical protein